MKSDARRAGIGAALAGIGSLYVFSALGLPLGAYNDDALHVLLARSLAHGAYLRPDGGAETTFLPGMPALLALPTALVEPRYGWLRLVGLSAAFAAALLSWRLLRRALPRGYADATAGIVALNWVLVDYAGSVMPDIPLLGLTIGTFLIYRSRSRRMWLIAATALASLFRPEGALVIPAFALALWLEEGFAAALRFAVPAALPLCAWLARNRLEGGTILHYFDFGRLGSSPAALLGELFGRSLLGGPALLALAAAPLAALGAARAWKGQAWLRPAALYIAFYLLLHLLWRGVSEHYLIPILPIAWLFIALGLEALLGSRPKVALGLGALALAGNLARDWTLASAGALGPVDFQPETMAFLREKTPPEAKVESLRHAAVILWSGRACVTPGYFGTNRDAWLADALEKGVSFVHVEPGLAMTGVFPELAEPMNERLLAWAKSSPYLRFADASMESGGPVFIIQVSHPAPARFLAAWRAYQAAGPALSRSKEAARAKLKEAVELEPTLAYAWAALAEIAPEPKQRRRYLERAAMADATDLEIRKDLLADRLGSAK